jgi:hypothetical protein
MSETLQATLPERVGGREEAREFLKGVFKYRTSLSGYEITILGEALKTSGASYIDELVKKILVEFNASRLVFEDAPNQAARDALLSAKRRGVADRLVVNRRT